jgi:hypothetical protein
VKPGSDNGISISALVIASVSSVAAAVVVHALWAPGTLAGAAAMPVLVELFAEVLRRPTRRLVTWAPYPTGDGLPAEPQATLHVYRVRPRWLRATGLGLLAFVVAAVGLTGGEALLHRSLGSAKERTTLLGGRDAPSPVVTEPPPVVTVTVPVATPRLPEQRARRDDRGRAPRVRTRPDRPARNAAPATPAPSAAPTPPATPPTSTTTTPSEPPPSTTTPAESAGEPPPGA